jgi:hypothetical protein
MSQKFEMFCSMETSRVVRRLRDEGIDWDDLAKGMEQVELPSPKPLRRRPPELR